MKTRVLIHLVAVCVLIALFPFRIFAGDAPTYRGKVVMIVDKTIAADPDVGPRIERLINDLTGDGWRVLRHDVDRGPELSTPLTLSAATAQVWAQQNGPRVREIRGLIQADYNAAPTEVKSVFLIGHIPIPYSGLNANASGGHYLGCMPADSFYGDVTTPYGPHGWTDTFTELAAPNLPESDNLPGDGKFDQDFVPAMSLAVGRVDLSIFISDVNETTLIARYLDKDHDFRCGNFTVPSRAIFAEWADPRFQFDPSGFANLFDSISTFNDDSDHWFVNVDAPGDEYLLGYGAGFGGGDSAAGIGSTANIPGGDPTSNFQNFDSRVVFVNLYGSFFGDFDEADFLKAPLGNPYDPANGRFGYGLDCVWSNFGLNQQTLTARMLGATIGEALYVIPNFAAFTCPANDSLMGDPTLRMHVVPPVSNLGASVNGASVNLTWTASADPGATYNIYYAPTHKGPFVLVNTGGPVSGNTYTAARPTSGAPDNFYMVRAVDTENNPAGSYLNMSEGVLARLPGQLTPYLAIISQPASQNFVEHAQHFTANSASMTVDAVGVDSAGSEHLNYYWFKDGAPLTDDGHFVNVNTPSLLIKGLQTSDAGNYYVVVNNIRSTIQCSTCQLSGSMQSSTASLGVDLTLNTPPTISSIPDQQMIQDSTLDVPFTVGSAYTALDNLTYSVSCSDPTLIPASRLTITGSGSSRNLHIDVTGVHKIGTGTVTITFTDDYGASTSASFQVTVNVDNSTTLLGQSHSGNNFSFVITGPNNSTVQIWESDDLATWVPLGSVTLNGNSYQYVDTTAGAATHRFYRVANNGNCAVNTIGFINLALPAGQFVTIANQLNNPLGNTYTVLLAGVPVGTAVYKFDLSFQSYDIATKRIGIIGWGSSATKTLNPGEGALIKSPTAQTLTLVGDVPQGQQILTTFPTTVNGLSMLNSMIPLAGKLDSLGFPALSGDQIQQYNVASQQFVTTATYDGAWHPTAPTVQIGESFFVQSSSTSPRTWTENLPACPPTCDPPPSGMAAWWRAEGNANDSIGGNNGTTINNLGFEPGEVGAAFSLDGSSSYVLVQSSNPSLNVGAGTGMTIEGWINPVSVSREQLLTEWERILGSGSGTDVGALFYIEPSGTLNANIEDTSSTSHTITSAPNALTANTWQHVAVTYDKSSGIAALYVNGAVIASQNVGSFTPQTSFPNLLIGARTYLGSEFAPISVFGGGMDEWAIYNRALSPNEISAIYASGSSGKCFTPPPCDPAPSGIASWWRAENNTVDSVGVNNGTAINNLGFEPGEVGTAFSLDGSSSYLLVQSSDPSLNVGIGTGMTIEGWINPTSVNREQLLTEWERILGSGSGFDVGALFYIEPSGTLNANIEDTSSTPHTITSAPNALTANTWQHVAVTYDKSSGIAALYVNGAVIASQNVGSFTPQTSFPNLLIGARTYLGSEFAPISVFGGGMDEWAIYNRALSPNEISAIYGAGPSGKCPSQ